MVGQSRTRQDERSSIAASPAPSRLFGVDLARGVAILGMLWVHMAPDGTGFAAPDGRSAILFATLAGVSLGLLTGGANPPPRGSRWLDYRTVAIRGVVLIVLGRLLVLLETPIAVILDYYGAAFLILLVVLFAPRWVLALVGLLALTVGAWLVQLAGPDPGAAFLSRNPLEWPEQWLLTGLYPIAIFAAYVVAGLIAARSDLASRRTQVFMLVGGLVIAPVGYLLGAALGVDAGPHADTTWEAVGSGAVALAVIGLCQLLGETVPLVRRLLSPVADIGSMPLTIYTAQILAAAAFLAARPSSGGSEIQNWWLLAGIVGGSLLFATVWRRLLGRGPLERVLAFVSRADRTIDGRRLPRRGSAGSPVGRSTGVRPGPVLLRGLAAGAAGGAVVLALSSLIPVASPSGADAVSGRSVTSVGGTARLEVDAAVLRAAGVELGGAGAAQLDGSIVELPILAGEFRVDSASTGGGLVLDGAVSLRAGAHTVLLDHLVLDLDAGTIAGDLGVDGSPVVTRSLLFLVLPRTPPPSSDTGSSVAIDGLTVSLTPDTAGLLNEGLATQAFADGAPFGMTDLEITGS